MIPRIISAEVGSKSLAYLIRPGSDFWGDQIRYDTGHIRTRTYVLACAYALRAVRQHRARPYRIALLVLTLPHSNAEEERVFNLVTKNVRLNLKLDGTLSSILTIKLANTAPCQDYEPPKEVLESAYNRAHSSKTVHVVK